MGKKKEAAAGNGFSEVYTAYYDTVYAMAYKLMGNSAEAEDVAQEVFLRLYQDADAAKSEADGIGNAADKDVFRKWAETAVKEQALELVRGRKEVLLEEERLGLLDDAKKDGKAIW